jgi:hypothetical protein
MPKSGEQDDQAAPREAAASMAMIDSGMLGTKPATRSPAVTPASFKPGHPGHLIVELGVGIGPPHPVFSPEDQRQPVVPVAQQVFGKVEAGTLKPTGAGHPGRIIDHLFIGHRGLDRGEVPHLLPEFGDVVDGPLIKAVVTVK